MPVLFPLFFFKKKLGNIFAYHRRALSFREHGSSLHLLCSSRLLPSSCPPGTARCYWLRSDTPEQSQGRKCTFLPRMPTGSCRKRDFSLQKPKSRGEEICSASAVINHEKPSSICQTRLGRAPRAFTSEAETSSIAALCGQE